VHHPKTHQVVGQVEVAAPHLASRLQVHEARFLQVDVTLQGRVPFALQGPVVHALFPLSSLLGILERIAGKVMGFF